MFQELWASYGIDIIGRQNTAGLSSPKVEALDICMHNTARQSWTVGNADMGFIGGSKGNKSIIRTISRKVNVRSVKSTAVR
jgi:hypothetical protein